MNITTPSFLHLHPIPSPPASTSSLRYYIAEGERIYNQPTWVQRLLSPHQYPLFSHSHSSALTHSPPPPL